MLLFKRKAMRLPLLPVRVLHRYGGAALTVSVIGRQNEVAVIDQIPIAQEHAALLCTDDTRRTHNTQLLHYPFPPMTAAAGDSTDPENRYSDDCISPCQPNQPNFTTAFSFGRLLQS